MTPAAARVEDPIAHDVFAPALKRAGFAMGAAVEILLIVGTGGLKKGAQIGIKLGVKLFVKRASKELIEETAKKSMIGLIGGLIGDLADVLDGMVIGHWLGDKAGGLLDYLFGTTGGMETGKVSSGAKRTFIEGKAAARMRDDVECSGTTTMVESVLETALALMPGGRIFSIGSQANKTMNLAQGSSEGTAHVGMKIAQGSLSVNIENFPAARVGDATKCDAVVMSGAATVGIGGTRITDPIAIHRHDEGDGVGLTYDFLTDYGWLIGVFGSAFKFLDGSNTDGISAWLKMFAKQAGDTTVLPIVDRAQKIASNLAQGKKLTELTDNPVKGLEITAAKVLKGGDGDRSFDTGDKQIRFRSNGDVVIVKGRVTDGDVQAAREEMSRRDELERRRTTLTEDERRRKEVEVFQPPRRHPGYRR